MSDINTMFRGAMRRIAATVNVVTIELDGVAMGMTATAVSSLSADPPSLLVCVNQSASMHDSLALASHFCVNVLHHDQVAVAKTFSDNTLRDVRFAEGGWHPGDHGPPILPNAQASLICERSQLIAFATHTICIGAVVAISIRNDVDPLVYVDGRFCQAA